MEEIINLDDNFFQMKVANLYNQNLPLFELALRIYIACYLADYGYVKLTGGMFNNATPEILKSELQKVNQFHLAWYFFYKIKLLTYTVGICQLLSAILLLFNKTVLWGCALALPIFINIFLIDVSVFVDNALAIRVFLYIMCVLLFVYYRRAALLLAYKNLMQNALIFKVQRPIYYIAIPILLFLYLLLEIFVTRFISYFL